MVSPKKSVLMPYLLGPGAGGLLNEAAGTGPSETVMEADKIETVTKAKEMEECGSKGKNVKITTLKRYFLCDFSQLVSTIINY